MRTHPILILAFLLPLLNVVYTQSPCLPNGITFTSQEQIDAFPSNYPGCTEIAGSVTIEESIEGDIICLDSLYPITSIGEDLGIFGNAALISLDGLDCLISIGQDLRIGCFDDGPKGNAALTSLGGLDSLTSIEGDLWIEDNGALTSLSGLESITSIGGSLIVGWGYQIGFDLFYPTGNNSLTSLNGLNSLTSIGQDFWIVNNDSLTSLSGLDSLTSIGGSLNIGVPYWWGLFGNASLMSLEGLNSLTSIGGVLSIIGNNALTSLEGLPNSLTSIGVGLKIEENGSLTNLEGLPNSLTSLEVGLQIVGNDSLTSLSGLENLTSIGGLWITSNGVLTSLSGLDSLDYTTIESLYIRWNPVLSICEIQPICDYLEHGGYAFINNNAPGCDSQQEVVDACQAVSVNNLLLDEAIQLFPNPSTGIIQITAPGNTEWKVSVRDAMGQMIIQPYQFANGEIDLSRVPPGLYFLELNNGQHSITKRIIKQ